MRACILISLLLLAACSGNGSAGANNTCGDSNGTCARVKMGIPF